VNEGIVKLLSNPAWPGRAALVGLAGGVALLAGIGAAEARVFLDVGIGLPGVVVAPPVVAPPPVVVVAPPVLPPAPVEAVPVAPAPAGYVWVPGAYAWNGAGYVWVPGRYVLPPWPGGVWLAGGWYRGPHGWAWRRGYWR
jgi:hypothetical protein